MIIMSKFVELDSIDKKILGTLQEDATLSIQAISQRVGLSANPCWRRIKRLEDLGVIERRAAIIDPVTVGLSMTAFVTIRTSQHEVGWLESFATAVASIAEILECHRMSGEVDYLLKIVVRDIAHYDNVYQRLIAAVPGLIDVTSTFSMERLKHGTQLDLSTI